MALAVNKNIRILIVEDYRIIRIGLRTMLDKTPGLEVVGEAISGEQAIHRVEQIQPDVVLMDLGLPGIDGIEATRQIKKSNPSVRILVLTSHDSEEEMISCLMAGAHGFCLKDIEIQDLVHVIQTVYQGGVWIAPKLAQVALQFFTEAGSFSPRGAEPDYGLSPREKQVLEKIVEGKSNTEIAAELGVSSHTVKAIVSHLLEKLSVSDRIQAAVKAVREKIVVSV